MKSTFLILCLATAFGQSDAGEWVLSPQLAAGTELVYSGTSTEESLLPGIQYARTFRVENYVLVTRSDVLSHDVAIMTVLSARGSDDATKTSVASVRLDLAKVDPRGKITPFVEVNGAISSLIETGCFIEAPISRVGRNSVWEAGDAPRPPRTWALQGAEACGGLSCVKLIGTQQSDDWDRPRADHAAWRRRDVVWLSLQMGVAVKVERTVERRDPARREPTHRTVTHYTLESRMKYPGKLLEDRKRDAMQAKKFADEAAAILAQPGVSTEAYENLLRKVTLYIENSPTTPYRKALVQVAQRVGSAQKGELLQTEFQTEEPAASLGPLRVGQKAPDTLLTDLATKQPVRFNRLLGRPTLVLYYNPRTETGVDVLGFAKGVAESMGDQASVVALAVTNDSDYAIRQRGEMKLPFAVHDGAALRLSFGVDATPRFVVLDGEGRLQSAITGWAPHIGEELVGELRRCRQGVGQSK